MVPRGMGEGVEWWISKAQGIVRVVKWHCMHDIVMVDASQYGSGKTYTILQHKELTLSYVNLKNHSVESGDSETKCRLWQANQIVL